MCVQRNIVVHSWDHCCCGKAISITYSECGFVSKGAPQQAEVAQGVPSRLRPRIFLTFRHYKSGRSSVKSIDRLYPRRNQRLSRPQGTWFCRGDHGKNPPPGIDPGTVRLVAQRLNHYATPGPTSVCLQPQLSSMQCACAILLSVACLAVQYFSTLSHKWHDI